MNLVQLYERVIVEDDRVLEVEREVEGYTGIYLEVYSQNWTLACYSRYSTLLFFKTTCNILLSLHLRLYSSLLLQFKCEELYLCLSPVGRNIQLVFIALKKCTC